MVSARWLAGWLFPAVIICPSLAAWGVEVRAVALVESRSPSWKQVPASSRIDPQGLSFKRKVFLEGRAAIPVRPAEVRQALTEALKPLSRPDRSDTREVLRAIGEWTTANLAEVEGPLACPPAWHPADQVLRERRGNRFELVRAVVAMLRLAGIPSRPSFNGLPMVCLFAVPAGGKGFWTVWDPFHPSASLSRLPVAWLPLRAEEVPLVSTKPESLACEPQVEVRRFADRAEAEAVYAVIKGTGSFPAVDTAPLSADAREWWEVWAVGARIDDSPAPVVSVSIPLPFVIEPQSRCGTRAWGVWISEPARLKGRPSAHTRTDQELGGILMGVRVDIRPAPVSATTGA